MTTTVSLRRSLRKIPNFASFSRGELDAILAQTYHRDYKAGDVLWHTRIKPGLLGIIQMGEISVEHRFAGRLVRSVKLQAGDFVKSGSFDKGREKHISYVIRAMTDVRLYVLPAEQPNRAFSKTSNSLPWPLQIVPWQRLLTTIVVILVILFGWQDVRRILSGSLYLMTDRTKLTSYSNPGLMSLLQHAQVLDQTAAFLHTEEGYVWIMHGNLSQAEISFLNAIRVDQNSALALNNLAVTYSTIGKSQQAHFYQQKAHLADPNSAVVRYNLGVLLIQKNELHKALREFREATYIDPTWSQPYLQRAYIHIMEQDFLSAEKEARVAISLDSTQYSPYLFNSIALYNQGKHQEALTSVENALLIFPDDNLSKFYKALILIRLGELDKAYLILQQLLEKTNDPEQFLRITAEIESVQRSLQNHPFGVYKWYKEEDESQTK